MRDINIYLCTSLKMLFVIIVNQNTKFFVSFSEVLVNLQINFQQSIT